MKFFCLRTWEIPCPRATYPQLDCHRGFRTPYKDWTRRKTACPKNQILAKNSYQTQTGRHHNRHSCPNRDTCHMDWADIRATHVGYLAPVPLAKVHIHCQMAAVQVGQPVVAPAMPDAAVLPARDWGFAPQDCWHRAHPAHTRSRGYAWQHALHRQAV